MKNKFSITVRLIAAILIVGFLLQDIAWACPFEGYKNLAVTGLKNTETLQNLKTAMSRRLKTESPDMAKPNGSKYFDTYPDSDIVNSFIRNHIAEGRAIEIDEKEEKVVIIRRDYTNPRAPNIEDFFRINGIFSKIRQSKDPALLKKILVEKSNFRNLSSKEQEKIIQIIQSIRLNFILGHVIVCERPYEHDDIVAHARTGFNRYYHNLEPTVWMGEILFNRLTVKERAQLLLEEALHILKPWVRLHGKVDEAENPREVIEHDGKFIDVIDVNPATIDELVASALIAKSESPNMVKEKLVKDYQRAKSVYKDYVEAIFGFNLKLFVLMAKRMKAKRIFDEAMLEKAKADTEECLNKMEGEIRNFEGRLKDLPKDLSMIDSHNRAKEQFIKARGLISKNDESAANAALISALNIVIVSEAREEILKAKISRSSRRIKVSKEGHRIVMWQQKYIRLDEAAKTLIPVYTKIPFDLRWQAGRSLDEQAEGIMDGREDIMNYLERIDADQEIAERNPVGLTPENIDYILSGLGRVKVEETRLASIVLETIKELIKIESPAKIKYLLPIAKRYLKLRIEDMDNILYHLRIGRSEPLGEIIAKDNAYFISKILQIKEFMKEGKYDKALRESHGFKKNIEEYLAEPDLEDLNLMIWAVIHILKGLKNKVEMPEDARKQAKFWLNIIRERFEDSQYLNEFMPLFMEEYSRRRLAGNSASLKKDTFNDIFEDFVKSKQIIRDSLQTEALRILCYLYVFIQLEIKDPKKPSIKIANPLFKAINTLRLMTIVDDIEKILKIRRLKKLSTTLALLNGFKARKFISNLNSVERAQLIDTMTKDYSLIGKNIRDAISAERPESPNMAKERMLLNRQGAPSLPVNVIYNKILALNESEIIDNKDEHFILDIRDTKAFFYPIFVNIRRKQDHISIGTVELDIRYITVGRKYILDLGLAHISLKKYRNRGIFPRILSLISKVMPPNSKLDLSSLQETETLKALANGTGWSETRIGRILYRCGWEPEFISISDQSEYLEAVLLDKNNEWPESYNPDNFKVILRRAIKDIDKTDEISDGVTVYVRLAKITDGARIDESLSRERLSKPESPSMAKRNTEKINGEGIENMLLAIHSAVPSGINTNPFPEGSRVVLSSNLFEEMDRYNLERLLKGGNIEISDPKDIKRRATNNKVTRDKMVIVLTKEEFEAMWKNSGERLWIKSSVLLLDDRLSGANYLYLEGVIGLAKAIMGRDKGSIAAFYNMLSGMKLDEASLACLEDNAVAFAIKAILKFKPIKADSRQLENYKVIMEAFLLSA